MPTYQEMYQILDAKLGDEQQFKERVSSYAAQLRDIVRQQLQAPSGTVHWGIGGNGVTKTETIQYENGKAQFALMFIFAVGNRRADIAVQVHAVAHPEHIAMAAEGVSPVTFDGGIDDMHLKALASHVIEVLQMKVQQFKQ